MLARRWRLLARRLRRRRHARQVARRAARGAWTTASNSSPAAGIVEQLRAVKDDDEIDAIARAAAIADSIYATLAEEGLVGRTETDVAWRIEWLARERGASGLSFPPIVAAGAHGALPHAEPRDRRIEEGELVVLDLGVVHGGYCSDCTRTFATGRVSERGPRGLRNRARSAVGSARRRSRSGAECSAVDAAARDLISERGYGDQFGHSTGHGVGIDVHELPTLVDAFRRFAGRGQRGHRRAGHLRAGEFGVRIEDLVVVADDGAARSDAVHQRTCSTSVDRLIWHRSM